MLNNQKENKEFLGKEGMGFDPIPSKPDEDKGTDGAESCDSYNADIDVSAASVNPKTVQSAQISGLNHVANSTNMRSEGQCTEACIAMWANRFSGSNLSADDVYRDMEIVAKQHISEGATPSNINAAYMLGEYYHCGPCSNTKNPLSPNAVLSKLQSGKPIIMYIKNASSGGTHAVIVKGIEINGTSVTYTIDDPNCGTGTIKQSTSANTASEVINTYTSIYTSPSGGKSYFTFNRWYTSIHNTV